MSRFSAEIRGVLSQRKLFFVATVAAGGGGSTIYKEKKPDEFLQAQNLIYKLSLVFAESCSA